MLGIKRRGGYRDDAHCETLTLLADALLVFDQLVDERLKQRLLKKLKNNPQPLNVLGEPSYPQPLNMLGEPGNPQPLNILEEPTIHNS